MRNSVPTNSDEHLMVRPVISGIWRRFYRKWTEGSPQPARDSRIGWLLTGMICVATDLSTRRYLVFTRDVGCWQGPLCGGEPLNGEHLAVQGHCFCWMPSLWLTCGFVDIVYPHTGSLSILECLHSMGESEWMNEGSWNPCPLFNFSIISYP